MADIDGEAIAAAARSLVGTPFHYGGRIPGVGIDCAGVVACAFASLGVALKDARSYPGGDQYPLLESLLSASFDEVGAGNAQPGDVLLFRRTQGPASRRVENHVGIATIAEPLTMVHAFPHGYADRVVEAPLSRFFIESLVAAYRYRAS